ncbi:MAG: hypothetical protein ACI81W_002126 [Saprospiraceae bacterium]|jgi:hypothetical protein
MGENAQRMITDIFDWKVICMQLYDEYVSACKLNAAIENVKK